ncbi:hypothetical protein P9990_17660 [Prescottella equi]|uniref:hypothetical protein n=1 Tax=Rhodococcus hoagii TaxID=43767 RepID=UPI0025777E03|nr:hypothetical protein [Prescottella equi]WJJ10399.1 hypothetical protein P9990_17660 [Prescottella equi]
MPDIKIDLPRNPRYRIFKHNGRWHAVDTRTGIRLANRATWTSAIRAVNQKIAAGRRELARVTSGDYALAAGGHR